MLKDKVVLITGASSGIGFTTAVTLSKAGAKIVAGARRVDRLRILEKEIQSYSGEISIISLDVTKKDECKKFAEFALEKHDRIDVLINNAGLMPLSFFKNLKIDEWDRMVDVNLKGVLYATAAVVPNMLSNKSGHIVNISSIAGRIVFPAGSVYCATKHAVTAFSEGLRQELSQRANIRVTCIEPGVVDTELNNTITDNSLHGFIESVKKMQPLEAQNIADAIKFAIDSPGHMNVNEIMIRPLHQER
jgi:NADP-dependent 3-hydroxy acid dehydrogenase YdfG